jgi:hypothetical protein
MATSFTTAGVLQGSIKTAYQTATSVANMPAPKDGFIWRRQVYSADLYRFGKGLSGFESLAGTRIPAATLSTTNGVDTLEASGDPYLVTVNDMNPSPSGSGMWKETLIAVRYEDWAEWELQI